MCIPRSSELMLLMYAMSQSQSIAVHSDIYSAVITDVTCDVPSRACSVVISGPAADVYFDIHLI